MLLDKLMQRFHPEAGSNGSKLNAAVHTTPIQTDIVCSLKSSS
jgi:hypothetical protein